MIETAKRWIEKIKSSPILKPFIKIKVWFQENIIKRKLVIFSMLFVTWLTLLMGAIFSPQRQTYTSEQLKTKQVFANGSGEMKLVSQEYSPDTGIIVLQFETKDATTSIDRGIDAKRLKWKLYAQHKDSKIEMDVVPIIDNKVSVIIKGVPKNFGAFAIDVTNQTVASSSIDVNISSPSSDSKKVSQKKSEEDDTVQFFVTSQNTQLEIKAIEVVSREEFTLQEIEKEINFQNEQSQKLTTSIAQLKESIEDDNSRKASLQAEAKYLTGDDLEANQKNIATLDTNIETKNRTIETAYKNIEKLKAKLESLDKKKQAVKDGTFEFSNPIETVEMN
ncbi:hypothetical protein SMID22_17380 [Streptococcus mitis]|uniref:hypothetical protein n=1 Tax=Streptococcus mitis TaxID=28037 RepID=UPI00398BFFAC